MRRKIIRKITLNEVQRLSEMLGIEKPPVYFRRDKAVKAAGGWGEFWPCGHYDINIVNEELLDEEDLMGWVYHIATAMRAFWQKQSCDDAFFEASVFIEDNEEDEETEYPLADVDSAAFGLLYTIAFCGGIPQHLCWYGTEFDDCVNRRMAEISLEFHEAESRVSHEREYDF